MLGKEETGQEKLISLGWAEYSNLTPSTYPSVEIISVHYVRLHMMGIDNLKDGNNMGAQANSRTRQSTQEGDSLSMHFIETTVSGLWENSLGKCFCQHSNKALQRGTSQNSTATEPKGNSRVRLLKRYKASLVQSGFTVLPVQPRIQVPCSWICDSLWFYRSPNYKESSLAGAWIVSRSSKNIHDNQTAPTGFSIEDKYAELAGGLFKESK